MYYWPMIDIDYDNVAAQLCVIFGDNRTQKAVKDTVRVILSDVSRTTLQANDDTDLARLCNLLVLSHPRVQEKYDNGLPVEYRIGPDRYGNMSITTIDPNGVKDDFSWNKAAVNASRLMKSSTSQDRKAKLQAVQDNIRRANVINAMRRAIDDQIDEFRDEHFINHGGRYVSEITGEYLHPTNTHVDHHPVEFADIAKNWLNSEGLELSDVAIKDAAGSFSGFFMSDLKQKKSWSEYHRSVAQLRIVSQRENLTKKKEVHDAH